MSSGRRRVALEGHAAPLPVVAVAGIDLWRIDLDWLPLGASALLTADELARAGRFVFDRDRTRFVAGRAAVRLLLADHAGSAPEALVFELGPYGKPHLAGGPPFSYSNSGAWGLLALGGDRPLGVDLERIREVPDAAAVAASAFGREDLIAWQAAGSDPRAGFLRVWTRKEATLKALGLGLAGEERVTAELRSAVDVFDVDFDPDHAAALAVVRGPEPTRPG